MNSENLTFILTADEINFIGSVLRKLPFEDVAGLITKLQIQAAQQQQAPAAPVAEAPAAPAEEIHDGSATVSLD